MRVFLRLDILAWLGLLSILLPCKAWADRARPYFQSSRAMAMGDAFTPHDEGYESVYYNPASVARPREFMVKPFDLEGIISKDAFSFFKNSSSSVTQMSKMAEALANDPGRTYSMGFAFLPQLIVKNFSFGLMARSATEAFVEPDTLNLNSYAFADVGAYAAIGFSLMGGVIKIGGAGRVLDRAELNRTYTPSEYQGKGLDYSSQWQEGMGYAGDLGLIITAPVFGFPRLAIAVLDVGGTKMREQRTLFTGDAGKDGAPPDIPQRINVGVGTFYKMGKGSNASLNFELKDVENALHGNPIDSIHMGAEAVMLKKFSLRAGLNDGRYWTAGAGLHILKIGLEFATYGENISHKEGGRTEDRKYVLRTYVEF